MTATQQAAGGRGGSGKHDWETVRRRGGKAGGPSLSKTTPVDSKSLQGDLDAQPLAAQSQRRGASTSSGPWSRLAQVVRSGGSAIIIRGQMLSSLRDRSNSPRNTGFMPSPAQNSLPTAIEGVRNTPLLYARRCHTKPSSRRLQCVAAASRPGVS